MNQASEEPALIQVSGQALYLALFDAGLSRSMMMAIINRPDQAEQAVDAITKALTKAAIAAPAGDDKISRAVLSTPITEELLAVRVVNRLRSEGIETIADLILTPESKVVVIRGMGDKSIQVVREMLASFKVDFVPPDVDPRIAALRVYGSPQKLNPRHLWLWNPRIGSVARQFLREMPSMEQLLSYTADELKGQAVLVWGVRRESLGLHDVDMIELALTHLNLQLQQ